MTQNQKRVVVNKPNQNLTKNAKHSFLVFADNVSSSLVGKQICVQSTNQPTLVPWERRRLKIVRFQYLVIKREKKVKVEYTCKNSEA